MRTHPLKQWRLDAGLTQTEAATRIGVTKQAWAQWEAALRIPHRQHIRKIERITGVRPDLLYAAAS
jgi:transcriptional regulator with XRE-family HTH domain